MKTSYVYDVLQHFLQDCMPQAKTRLSFVAHPKTLYKWIIDDPQSAVKKALITLLSEFSVGGYAIL